jgi:hypothetical protein
MVTGLSLASTGIVGNLIVYLISEFNIKSITAAQIVNIVVGSTSLIPLVAAILADSFFGSFSVAFASSCVSLLVNYIYLNLYIYIIIMLGCICKHFVVLSCFCHCYMLHFLCFFFSTLRSNVFLLL